jgi:DNA-binding CsgD family transcriptional regulator
MATDLIDVIEAAYRPAESDEAWLGEVARAAGSAGLDRGLGVCGWFYDVSQGMRFWSPCLQGTPVGTLATLEQLSAFTPTPVARRFFHGARATCSTLSARLGSVDRTVYEQVQRFALAPLGVGDFLGLAATEADGCGCMIGAPLPDATTLDRRQKATWTRIAAHLLAGRRMRQGDRTVDAIIDSSYRAVHAEGAARESARDLEDAARGVDRSRGSLRHQDPDEAVASWRSLVLGQWSLVDHFDHDGKRYLVAVRNDRPRAPAALTPGEEQALGLVSRGCSNKLAAYELGIAPSTLAMRLRSAARKLGTSTRVETIRFWKSLQSGGQLS